MRGAYACVAEIAGYGMLAFRDPHGIRPLCYGVAEADQGVEYLVASESVALEGLGFRMVRDIEPGEAIFVDLDGNFHSRQCAPSPSLNPCVFEYVYFARPDSILDGASVYSARLRMGEYLAERLVAELWRGDVDVVMPIPDTSRPSAMQLAMKLGLDYREGFLKNRYVGRTFIMPGQAVRKKSVRQKLNAMSVEFKGKNVLLVDDSIVRGTTSREIVQMARDSGANKVFFASAAPPVRYPERLRHRHADPQRTDRARPQRRGDPPGDRRRRAGLPGHRRDEASVTDVNPRLKQLRGVVLRRRYVTGDVTPSTWIGSRRAPARGRAGARRGRAEEPDEPAVSVGTD